MTKNEIIEMPPYLNASYEGDDLYTGDQVRELMKLVAAKEREACAKVCDELSDKHTWEGCYANECADAIRARGELS